MTEARENSDEEHPDTELGAGHPITDCLIFLGKWAGAIGLVAPYFVLRVTLLGTCLLIFASLGIRQLWLSRKSPLGVRASTARPGRLKSGYFVEVVEKKFDTTRPLKWSYVLKGVKLDQLVSVTDALTAMGFGNVRSELKRRNYEQQYMLRFDEVGLHTAESYAARLEAVRSFATEQGLKLVNHSADRDDPQPLPSWSRPLVMLCELAPKLGVVFLLIFVYCLVRIFVYGVDDG